MDNLICSFLSMECIKGNRIAFLKMNDSIITRKCLDTIYDYLCNNRSLWSDKLAEGESLKLIAEPFYYDSYVICSIWSKEYCEPVIYVFGDCDIQSLEVCENIENMLENYMFI